MKATKLERQDQMKYPNLGKNKRFLNSFCSKNAKNFVEWIPPIVSEYLVLLVSYNFSIDHLFSLLQNLFYPRIITYKNMLFFDFTFDQTSIDELILHINQQEIQKQINQVNLYQIFNPVTDEELLQIQELNRSLLFFWNLLYSSFLVFELNEDTISFYAKQDVNIEISTTKEDIFSFQSLIEELQHYDFDFCTHLEFLLAFSDFLHPSILNRKNQYFLECLFKEELRNEYQQSSNIANLELAMNIFEIDFQDQRHCENFCFFLSLVWNLGFKKRGLQIRTKIGIDEDEMFVAQISVGR
ncbi:hypothetical protein BBW65_05730 [Helicobacter enhydrae]|uniref:Uncharacterized protein n=1 Tax=Helicobacter enhydrae TaxID=222136 RepID=A0A1B1U6D9_9HELI|nr:hypothetical protein [Helicobacter enhydrae]ANV98329.1 hypothetical protein BBW65_05730 [Helicobacter enhydrae]